MWKAIILVTIALLNLSSILCREAQTVETTRVESSNEDDKFMKLSDAMKECNETFRIEESFLESLNISGSFPDESEKTPKCYIQCLLMTTGVSSEDGQFNSSRTALVYQELRNDIDLTEVEQEASACAEKRDEKCKCERSYQFLKCIRESQLEKKKETLQKQ